jgi:Tfp pilus assembly protein PilF
VQLRPRDQQAYYHLAAVYVARGLPNEARPLLESVVREHPDFIEAHVLLASVYYRLNRNADGKREQEIIQKLNAQQQSKQPGSQDPDKGDPAKPPANPPSEQIQVMD